MSITFLCIIVPFLYSSLGQTEKKKIWEHNRGQQWEDEWAAGNWDYMAQNTHEVVRTAMISGFFFQKYAKKGLILDIGCGEGVVSDYLMKNQRSKYTGIDVSKTAITKAKSKRPDLNFQVTRVEDFNTNGQLKYDMIVFSEMLYFTDHVEVVKRFSGYLNPNGVIAISLWSKPGHKSERMSASMYDDISNILTVVDYMVIRAKAGPHIFMLKVFRAPNIVYDQKALSSSSTVRIFRNNNERARSAIIAGLYYQTYAKNSNFLDVGCGRGFALEYLNDEQRSRYVGIDHVVAMKAYTRKPSAKNLIYVDRILDYDPKGVKFDVIAFNERLCEEESFNCVGIVTKFLTYLKPGGLVLLSDSHKKGEPIHSAIQSSMVVADWCDMTETMGGADSSQLVDFKFTVFANSLSNLDQRLSSFRNGN